MSLLTVDEIRQHVETDLGDTALGRLIDDADGEIIDRLGALASQVEVIPGGEKYIVIARKAISITAIVERIRETDYALGADDYTLLSDKRRVQRLQGSTVPSIWWQGLVTITYVPVDETIPRKRLLVDLVRLSASYTALSSVGVGDVRMTNLDYQAERDKLFETLLGRNRLRFA
jgi:hypothetical protein